MGPKATDLISSAQVTPLSRRIAERQRRRLSKGRSHKLWDVRDVHRVALRGMGRPGFERTGLTSATWDFSAGCENPRTVQMDGAPCTLQGRRKAGRGFGLTMYVRCRKCPPCLGRRRNLWAYRAQEEIQAAPRTWMATFTWSPMQHFIMRARASARLAAGGVDIELIPAPEQFAELTREYGAELTKYFKRLRKNTGAKLRYILVAERHKSGYPHYHALIHEDQTSTPLRHAVLSAGWKLGFTRFTLVQEAKSAWYVAKYLAKSAETRVRASFGYGNAPANSPVTTPLWPSEANRFNVPNHATPTPLNAEATVANKESRKDAPVSVPTRSDQIKVIQSLAAALSCPWSSVYITPAPRERRVHPAASGERQHASGDAEYPAPAPA